MEVQWTTEKMESLKKKNNRKETVHYLSFTLKTSNLKKNEDIHCFQIETKMDQFNYLENITVHACNGR